MTKKTHKTFEDFDNKYNLNSKEVDTLTGEDGRFETYGEDLERIIKINEDSPKNVWTAIDGEIGLTFVPGLHMTNRVYFISTPSTISGLVRGVVNALRRELFRTILIFYILPQYT